MERKGSVLSNTNSYTIADWRGLEQKGVQEKGAD